MRRDPERIDRILGLLSKIWHMFPDARLGQLLYNIGWSNDENYNVEDDDIEKKLLMWYNRTKK